MEEGQPAPPNHRAFLVRFWRNDAAQAWRVRVRAVSGGEEQVFPDVNAFVAFIQTYFSDSKGESK
jgi:hypothetical protein